MNGETGEIAESAGIDEREAPHAKLFKATQGALHSALFYALQVAGEKDGQVTSMSQTELASASSVSRHSIGNYLSNGDVSKNPDLDTLCRIAAALNVPPALLILTRDDWKQLANAALYLVDVFEDPVIQQAVEKLNESNNPRAHDRAEGGLRVAERAELYKAVNPGLDAPEVSSELRDEVLKKQRAQRQAIRVSSAIAPLQSVPSAYHGPLLWLTAYLGATSSGDQ